MLNGIRDRRIQQKIGQAVDRLSENPESQGGPLVGDLSGCRSLRASGQRYRIIYRVNREKLRVEVCAVGIRKEGSKVDIYALARRLVRLGLLAPGPK